MNSNNIVSIKKINQYCIEIKKGMISHSDIPDEYQNHPKIVNLERKLGLRISKERGYDILRKAFFVVEDILHISSFKSVETIFDNFESYFNFLNGDIYNQACYFQYKFSEDEIKKYSIQISKINNISLIHETMDDYTFESTAEEIKEYKKIEKEKKFRQNWIDRINICNNDVEFYNVFKKFRKSRFYCFDFIVWCFVFSNKEKAFDILMNLINDDDWYKYEFKNLIYSLYYIYRNEKDVLSLFKGTANRRSKFKKFIKNLNNSNIKIETKKYFDIHTHYYCCETVGSEQNEFGGSRRKFDFTRYFYDFEEFANYLDNDLSDCDLSKDLSLNIDLKKYILNKNTKLPITTNVNIKYFLDKRYNPIKDYFEVSQLWKDENGNIIKEYYNIFDYFFDFLYFVKNDLSYSNLLFCENLENVNNLEEYNVFNAKVQSKVLESLGQEYKSIDGLYETKEFIYPKTNEETKENEKILANRDIDEDYEQIVKSHKIYYITDLHLNHRLINANARTKNDVIYVIQEIIYNWLDYLVTYKKSILLIGGDVASSFELYKLFVELLRNTFDQQHINIEVVFILGNHELWDFPNKTIDEIVSIYKKLLTDNNMYLIHNSIIYMTESNDIKNLTSADIMKLSNDNNLLIKLNEARIVIFGGIGFSGYNEDFNANQGIYRNVLNRYQEIEKTRIFESIYLTILEKLAKKRVIIFTHMPLKDWSKDSNIHNDFVYVNGHTHRNYFYDDGAKRIYADNQIGYGNHHVNLKYFYMDDDYDYFFNFEDGIHEITREQYVNFYRGKNIRMDFNRNINILYMLKKNGYYCFIHENKNRKLCILNGGELRKLDKNYIEYYFYNMEKQIELIKNPLDRFTNFQKKISKAIQSIGGTGTIHGSIIDIDYYNHVYLNPIDLSITAYWALNITYKIVYGDIPTLLQEKCPELFNNYLKMLENNKSIVSVIKDKKNYLIKKDFEIYLETEIYNVSKEIKKMQKLYTNILSVWHEIPSNDSKEKTKVIQ